MGPLVWSVVAVIVGGVSVYVAWNALRLRRECERAGSRENAAAHPGELTAQLSKRPIVWFRLAFGFTVVYWAAMFAFYLTGLGSAATMRVFFGAFIVLTLPAVLISMALSLAFLRSARTAVGLSRMKGPLVTGIRTRAAILAAGWAGVAIFMLFFAITAVSRGL